MGTQRIDPDEGAYLVLVDYGPEGLSVYAQTHTVEEAMQAVLDGQAGGGMTIVKLVDIDLAENDKPD